MSRFVMPALLAAVATVVVGCATARSIKIQPGEGGEISISPRDSLEARQKAEVLMRQNCHGKNFKVTSEGEVVVGKSSSTSGSVDKGGGYFGGVRTNSDTTETNITEWRLTYTCAK